MHFYVTTDDRFAKLKLCCCLLFVSYVFCLCHMCLSSSCSVLMFLLFVYWRLLKSSWIVTIMYTKSLWKRIISLRYVMHIFLWRLKSSLLVLLKVIQNSIIVFFFWTLKFSSNTAMVETETFFHCVSFSRVATISFNYSALNLLFSCECQLSKPLIVSLFVPIFTVVVDENASELLSLAALKEPLFSRKLVQLIKILSAFRLVIERGDRVLECFYTEYFIEHVWSKEMSELFLAFLTGHLTTTPDTEYAFSHWYHLRERWK